MNVSLKHLSLIVFLPTIACAQLVDFGAQSQPAEPTGFTLLDIAPDTPAAALGLQPGDVVTQLDGRIFIPTTSLAQHVASLYSKGDQLSINWSRKGEQHSGKVILDREISEAAFNDRYKAPAPNNTKLPTPDPSNQQATETQSTIDELHKNAPNARAMANSLKMKIESNGTGVIMQVIKNTPEGDSISVRISGGEEKDVKITDKAGELIYKGTITQANLDEIPEKHRDTVRNMLIRSPTFRISPSTSLVMPRNEKTPEEDINDLLKNIETQEGE